MAATTPERAQESLRPGVFGPVEAGGRPRNGGPDWLRVLGLVASVLMVFVLATGGYYAYLLYDFWQDTGDVVIIRPDDGTSDFEAAPGAESALTIPDTTELVDRTTILLVGSDSRDGLTQEQIRAIGTENTGTDLTDTIILLQIDPETDAAAMLSFPRDLLVDRCDGSTGRINEAFFVGEQQREGGGPQCLIDTITALTQIRIDHYARVNFAGFVNVVDALGGVTFYLDEPLRDRFSGLDVPAGCVEFDGIKAIQFVRARRLDSDFGRIARQQRFAREMVRKAASVGTILNPARVTSLVNSISDTLETDTEFGAGEMIELVNSVRGISSGAVDGRTVPGVVGRFGEASVVRLLEDEAEPLFEAFRNGDLLPEGVGMDAGPVELGPANIIPIQVANGSAPDGTAAEAAEVLEALGYTVAGTGEQDNYAFSGSIVLYPETRQDQAEFLAEALGGLQISKAGSDVDELRLVLGSAFDPQRFAPAPAPTDTASPSETEDDVVADTPTEETFAGAELSDIQC